MTRSAAVLLFLSLCAAPCLAVTEAELYGPAGVTPQAVRQGQIGGCYFYAAIASIARAHPEALRKAIRRDSSGDVSVQFADGEIEAVSPNDAQFARTSGYDQSDGLWVAVLLRGFAQRTLRKAMQDWVERAALGPVMGKLAAAVLGNDLVLKAYDRAIRSQIDQTGGLDRQRLKARLRQELDSVPAPDSWKDSAIGYVDSSGFFDSVSEQVKANGELFGAYRAVGQGGIASRVMKAFLGSGESHPELKADEAFAAIGAALQKGAAVVVSTSDSTWQAVAARSGSSGSAPLEDWYLARHAYSVLGVNRGGRTITLRNPWGDRPKPNGEFTVPASLFAAACVSFDMSSVE
jgi:hypothetical protein